jgi:hypothetical protein
MTGVHSALGTMGYMSPEQASGQAADVDHKTDIFSMGVIVYELLSKRRPFVADSLPELAELMMREDPSPLRSFRPDLPAEVERVVLWALRKDPEDRPGSITRMAEAFTAAAGSLPLKPLPTEDLQTGEISIGTLTQPPEGPLGAPTDPTPEPEPRESPLKAVRTLPEGPKALGVDGPTAKEGRDPALGADTVPERLATADELRAPAGRKPWPVIAAAAGLLVAAAGASILLLSLGEQPPARDRPGADGAVTRAQARARRSDAPRSATVRSQQDARSDGLQPATVRSQQDAAGRPAEARQRALWLTTRPARVRVYIGARSLGVAPLSDVSIPVESFTLVLRQRGHRPMKRRIAAGDHDLKLHLTLRARAPRGSAKLRVVTRSAEGAIWADVRIDGRVVGRTPLSLDQPAGTHTVTVVRPGYRSETRTVTLRAGKSRALVLKMRRVGD